MTDLRTIPDAELLDKYAGEASVKVRVTVRDEILRRLAIAAGAERVREAKLLRYSMTKRISFSPDSAGSPRPVRPE